MIWGVSGPGAWPYHPAMEHAPAENGLPRILIPAALLLAAGCSTTSGGPGFQGSYPSAPPIALRPVPHDPVDATGTSGYASLAAPPVVESPGAWLPQDERSFFEGPQGGFGWREGVIMAAILGGFVPIFSSNDDAFETMGDTLQLTLPITAGVSTAIYGDEDGAWMFAKQFGTAWASVYALKFTLDKTRPSGSNTNSFPSGHTMGAFSGASFLQRRYGWLYGVPAYTGAVLTGFSRVDADAHFMDDVLAGASIAMMSNWYWTEPYAESVKIEPVATPEGLGVGIVVSGPNRIRSRPLTLQKPFEPRGHYELAFGPSFENQNDVAAPKGSAPTDISQFADASQPTITAIGTLTYYLTDRQDVAIRFTPYEVQDAGQTSAPFTFAGQSFAANTDTVASYILYELRARWRYNLLSPDSDWELDVGGGLAGQYTRAAFAQPGGVQAEVSEVSVLPVAHVAAAYKFNDRFAVLFDVDAGAWEDVVTWDSVLGLRYLLNERWDVGLDYQYYAQELRYDDLENDLDQNRLLFTIGYSF